MMDDDDVAFMVLVTPNHPIGALVWLIACVIAFAVVCNNNVECEKRTCPRGKVARLVDGECICVTKAR